MAAIALDIPAEQIHDFREVLRGELTADADEFPGQRGNDEDWHEAVLEARAKVNDDIAALDQIGWADGTEPQTLEGPREFVLRLLDSMLGEIAEDAAVASGEYKDHPLDLAALKAVGVRTEWLCQAREAVA
jgi:hypothetical protein